MTRRSTVDSVGLLGYNERQTIEEVQDVIDDTPRLRLLTELAHDDFHTPGAFIRCITLYVV